MICTISELTYEYAKANSRKLLGLEKHWQAIGDQPWDYDELMEELDMKWELSHAAESIGNIIGYQIGCRCDADTVYLKKLLILPAFRKRGIGKTLISSFLRKSEKKNFKKVRFRVRADNPALRFYENLGFTRAPSLDLSRPDKVPSYFFEDDVNEMVKRLS